MRLALVCFYCLCVFVYVLYFIATMSFAGYFLPVLFCMLSMLISDSRFDLVWFRLSCDHGWIRSGSVNVRKQQQTTTTTVLCDPTQSRRVRFRTSLEAGALPSGNPYPAGAPSPCAAPSTHGASTAPGAALPSSTPPYRRFRRMTPRSNRRS